MTHSLLKAVTVLTLIGALAAEMPKNQCFLQRFAVFDHMLHGCGETHEDAD